MLCNSEGYIKLYNPATKPFKAPLSKPYVGAVPESIDPFLLQVAFAYKTCLFTTAFWGTRKKLITLYLM